MTLLAKVNKMANQMVDFVFEIGATGIASNHNLVKVMGVKGISLETAWEYYEGWLALEHVAVRFWVLFDSGQMHLVHEQLGAHGAHGFLLTQEQFKATHVHEYC